MVNKNHPCYGCVYCGSIAEMPICHYIFIEDKMRGCPPGEGCTKKRLKTEEYEKTKKDRARAARDRMAEYRARRRAMRMKKKICPGCGREFETSDARQKYCSRSCATRARNIVWAERERDRRKKESTSPTGECK